jgi:hypothetical protein
MGTIPDPHNHHPQQNSPTQDHPPPVYKENSKEFHHNETHKQEKIQTQDHNQKKNSASKSMEQKNEKQDGNLHHGITSTQVI